MHEPGARPPCGRIEARLVGFGPGLAVAAERGIDQPLVERRQIIIGDCEAAAHRRRVVGDEHIGLRDEPAEHGLSRRHAQVERQTLLVAPVELEAGVALEPRADRRGCPAAIRVAGARRLDLDDFGAKVRHHRRGRRARDKAGTVDHPQAVEDALTHHATKRYASPSRTTWPAVRPAKCVPMTRIGVSARLVNMRSRVSRARAGSLSAVEDHSGRAIWQG